MEKPDTILDHYIFDRILGELIYSSFCLLIIIILFVYRGNFGVV